MHKRKPLLLGLILLYSTAAMADVTVHYTIINNTPNPVTTKVTQSNEMHNSTLTGLNKTNIVKSLGPISVTQNSTWFEMDQSFTLNISSPQGQTNVDYVYSPYSHKDVTQCVQLKQNSADPGVCYKYNSNLISVMGLEVNSESYNVIITVNSLK